MAGPEHGWSGCVWGSLAVWTHAVSSTATWSSAVVASGLFSAAYFGPKFGWVIGLSRAINDAYALGAMSLGIWCLLWGSLAGLMLRTLLRDRRWPASVALPMVWVVMEATIDGGFRHGLLLSYDPCRLALTQAGTFMAQVADVGGMALVGWWVAGVNGWLLDLWSFRQRRPPTPVPGILWWIPATCLITVVYAAFRPSTITPGSSLHAILIPVAISTSPGGFHQLPPTQCVRPPADIVIYPEGAWPAIFGADKADDERLRHAAIVQDGPILVGAERFSQELAGLLSSAILMTPAGAWQAADKRFLAVPQECRPPLADWLGITAVDRGFLAARTPQMIRMPSGIRWGVGVCHDLCFAEWAGDFQTSEVDGLIQIASEEFSRDPALRRQLQAVSRYRAIEARRTLVRCVKGGPSGVIDADGSMIVQVAEGMEHRSLDIHFTLNKSWSLSATARNIVVWVWIAMTIFAAEWFRPTVAA